MALSKKPDVEIGIWHEV